MRQISEPLEMSDEENRARLRDSERRRDQFGDAEGNRHERRLAAKRARQTARKQRAAELAE